MSREGGRGGALHEEGGAMRAAATFSDTRGWGGGE